MDDSKDINPGKLPQKAAYAYTPQKRRLLTHFPLTGHQRQAAQQQIPPQAMPQQQMPPLPMPPLPIPPLQNVPIAATPPVRPNQQPLIDKLKAELELKLVPMDQDLVPLYQSSIGVDLRVLRQGVTKYLAYQPLTMEHVGEAEALFKELRVKAEFVKRRDHKIGNRRRKLDEYSVALEFKAGAADALLNDKTLKAGEDFKRFAKALKAYELNAADKETLELTASIDICLGHFDKLKATDLDKVENGRKRKAVVEAQRKLAARAVVIEAKQIAVKGNWTREDESKATGNYLSMMLMMAEEPPKNLKGEKATEKVLAIRNIKGADKLVVKPITGELPVAGFKEGSGASREMMASVMGDKLQEMLGIELNVASTKLASIDGSLIGLEAGKPVTVSAQAFAKQAETLADKLGVLLQQKAQALGLAKADELPADIKATVSAAVFAKIPKEEVQNKAIFDLVSLHCDRHNGNFMIGADNKLVPIDHGNILPTKAGILARQKQLGPPHAVLATTPAAQDKLGDEQIERIERLNADDLMATMKQAQTEMRNATPDADKGDLDEGLNNSKRSIEFLKFACRELTLAEIYDAYSRSAGDIFFTDEGQKLAGFAAAVKFSKTYRKAASDLEAKFDELGLESFGLENQREVQTLLPGLQKRGWFTSLKPGDAAFDNWVSANPQKFLKILDPGYPAPPQVVQIDADVDDQQGDPQLSVPMPKLFNGANIKEEDWKKYQALGGDDEWSKVCGDAATNSLLKRIRLLREYRQLGGGVAWAAIQGKADEPLESRITQMNDSRYVQYGGGKEKKPADRASLVNEYEALGGDAAWARAGGEAAVTLADRIARFASTKYSALGGDVAWLRAGGDELAGIPKRVKVLQALADVSNIPID